MEKSLKKEHQKKSATFSPVITPAATKDKNKALNDIIGMWANRVETDDIKTFRSGLWRRKDN